MADRPDGDGDRSESSGRANGGDGDDQREPSTGDATDGAPRDGDETSDVRVLPTWVGDDDTAGDDGGDAASDDAGGAASEDADGATSDDADETATVAGADATSLDEGVGTGLDGAVLPVWADEDDPATGGGDEAATERGDDRADDRGPVLPTWAGEERPSDGAAAGADADSTTEGASSDDAEPVAGQTAATLDSAQWEGDREGAAESSPDDAQAANGGHAVPTHGIGGGSTAPDDEEMPLADHVEEMALRVMAVGLVVVGVGAITLFYADELINFLWYSFLGPGLSVCPGPACPDAVRPRIYHPLALVLARLKVASLVGMIAALPVAVYQTYRFMRPGLYPRERRYYLAAVPTSLVLAAVGVGFAYFAILPAMFSYFTNYSERAAEIAFGLTETFNLIVLMLGFFAITFQIPLLVMLAIMMGVTTRQWLADRRLYFWGGFAALAFLFSPDPTGMAPLLVAATMIVLFDGTLLLLKWTSSESLVPTAEGLAARRLYAWAVAVLAGYLASGLPVPRGYYDDLPSVARETLAANDLVPMTPVLIAGGLIAVFELGKYLLRRYGRSERALRARLAVHDARIPVWLVAVVVGYFGSPDPLFLRAADQVALGPATAVGLTVGLAVAYELAIQALKRRRAADAV